MAANTAYAEYQLYYDENHSNEQTNFLTNLIDG
jgi:hypothetical protein